MDHFKINPVIKVKCSVSRGIRQAYVEDGHLFMLLTDGTLLDLGQVIGPPGEVPDTVVQTVEQTLTEEEKQQARENIGAFSADGGIMCGPIDMGGSRLQNVGRPKVSSDAANREYVDDKTADCLLKSGGTMRGPINMGRWELLNAISVEGDLVAARQFTLGAGGADPDGGLYAQTPGPIRDEAGAVVKQPLELYGAFGDEPVLLRNLGEPEQDTDAATKKYVDDAVAASGFIYEELGSNKLFITQDRKAGIYNFKSTSSMIAIMAGEGIDLGVTKAMLMGGERTFMVFYVPMAAGGKQYLEHYYYDLIDGFIYKNIHCVTDDTWTYESYAAVKDAVLGGINPPGESGLVPVSVAGSRYVDFVKLGAEDIGALPLAGGTMRGSIDMDGNSLGNVLSIGGCAPQSVDLGLVNLIGGLTCDGGLDIDFSGCRIQGVDAPEADTDAVNKGYVDGIFKQNSLKIGSDTKGFSLNYVDQTGEGYSALVGLRANSGGYPVRLAGVAIPVSSMDAANKAYVDEAVASSAGGGLCQRIAVIPMTPDVLDYELADIGPYSRVIYSVDKAYVACEPGNIWLRAGTPGNVGFVNIALLSNTKYASWTGIVDFFADQAMAQTAAANNNAVSSNLGLTPPKCVAGHTKLILSITDILAETLNDGAKITVWGIKK